MLKIRARDNCSCDNPDHVKREPTADEKAVFEESNSNKEKTKYCKNCYEIVDAEIRERSKVIDSEEVIENE